MTFCGVRTFSHVHWNSQAGMKAHVRSRMRTSAWLELVKLIPVPMCGCCDGWRGWELTFDTWMTWICVLWPRRVLLNLKSIRGVLPGLGFFCRYLWKAQKKRMARKQVALVSRYFWMGAGVDMDETRKGLCGSSVTLSMPLVWKRSDYRFIWRTQMIKRNIPNPHGDSKERATWPAIPSRGWRSHSAFRRNAWDQRF